MDTTISYTSNFRSFFNFIFFVTIILLSIFGIGNYIFEKYIIFDSTISGASKIHRIITETHAGEIPVFGSSRANSSYVPSILGEKFYNYGIDGTGDDVMLFFLSQELEKNKKTPILINFDLNGVNNSLGDVNNYIPNIYNEDVIKLLGDKNKAYFQLPFVKYFGVFEGYVKNYLNEKVNLTKKTDNGGSFELNELTEKAFNKLVGKRKNTITNFKNNTQLLGVCYNLINSTDREIYFIVAPYHKSYFEQYENIDDAISFLSELSKLKNVKIINGSKNKHLDEEFMNTTHLNYKGAIEFSTWLSKKINNPHLRK